MSTLEASAPDSPRTGVRVRVQKLGTALSNMVMPNIGAFIAWGLITALFIEAGWLQAIFSDLKNPEGWVAKIGGWGAYDGAGIVGPMITYLLPVLIGYTGGRMIHGNRGAVVGAIATMGVVAGAEVPMFMGAMIMGPLGGWCMKKLDALWEGKIRPGFEMLVDNFSAGILGMLLAIFGFFGIGPIVSSFTTAAGNAVDFLVDNDLLPLTSILIEPAKVLFLKTRSTTVSSPHWAPPRRWRPGSRSCSCWRPTPDPDWESCWRTWRSARASPGRRPPAPPSSSSSAASTRSTSPTC